MLGELYDIYSLYHLKGIFYTRESLCLKLNVYIIPGKYVINKYIQT